MLYEVITGLDGIAVCNGIPLPLETEGGQDLLQRDKDGPLALVDVLDRQQVTAGPADLDQGQQARRQDRQGDLYGQLV